MEIAPSRALHDGFLPRCIEMSWKRPELEAAYTTPEPGSGTTKSAASSKHPEEPPPLLLPRGELAGGDRQLLLHNHLSTTDDMLELIFRRHLGKKNAFTTAEAPGRASPSREPKMHSKIKCRSSLTLACTSASSTKVAGQILPIFTVCSFANSLSKEAMTLQRHY